MSNFLVILFSLYFAGVLDVKHSHAGGEVADALAIKENLLKFEIYYASVH